MGAHPTHDGASTFPKEGKTLPRLRKTKAEKLNPEAPDGAMLAKRIYQERAMEHAEKVHLWRRASATLVARQQDLVVAKELAKAIATEASILKEKQDAKRALDEAAVAYFSFHDEAPIGRLVPDDEEAEAPAE